MFEIEKGISMPKRTSPGRPASAQASFGVVNLVLSMKVGDSILFPTQIQAQNIQSTAQATSEMKYSRRTVPGGCRLWCIFDDKEEC